MWLRISSEGLCKQVVPVCDKLAPARPAHGRYLATRWKTHIVDPDRQRYWLKRLLVIMVLTGDNGLLGSIWSLLEPTILVERLVFLHFWLFVPSGERVKVKRILPEPGLEPGPP